MLTSCWSQLGKYGDLSLALQAPAQHGLLRNAYTLTALDLYSRLGIFLPGWPYLLLSRQQITLKNLFGT